MRLLLLVISLLISVNAVYAEDAGKLGCQETGLATYTEVMNETRGMNCPASEYNIGRCMERDFFLSEAALAKANEETLATMDDPAEQAAFTKSAHAWCGYRDAVCEWEPSAQAGGSMSGQLSSQCRKERNEARAEILRKWIDCVTEGSCESPPLFFKLELR